MSMVEYYSPYIFMSSLDLDGKHSYKKLHLAQMVTYPLYGMPLMKQQVL